MKLYKIQIRSQKNSQSCVPLKEEYRVIFTFVFKNIRIYSTKDSES